AVRVEDHLPAAATHGLCFGGGHQSAAESLAAAVVAYPEVADLAASTPRPAVQPGDDLARVTDEDREQGAVGDAGPGDVELVEAILEEGHVGEGRHDVDGQLRVRHRVTMTAGRNRC